MWHCVIRYNTIQDAATHNEGIAPPATVSTPLVATIGGIKAGSAGLTLIGVDYGYSRSQTVPRRHQSHSLETCRPLPRTRLLSAYGNTPFTLSLVRFYVVQEDVERF